MTNTNGTVKATPYWWEEAPPLDRRGPLPAKVDVAVVGAGYTGLSAALTLAAHGRQVLVMGLQPIGCGASGRNGGHVGAKLRRGISSIAQEHGDAAAAAMWTAAREARAHIEDVVRRENISCDFEPCTRFYGAHKPGDLAGMKKTAQRMRDDLGFELEVVEREGQSRFVDSGAYFGGLVDRTTAAFHPSKYVHGLLQAAERAGVVVRSSTAVKGTDRESSNATRLRTTEGDVFAKQLVVATNGYTDGAFPELKRRMIPIGSYIVNTEPLSGNVIRSLMPGCDLVIDSRRCASYMRVSPDKRSIMYGGRVGATDISAEKSAPRLKAVLENIFPALSGVRLTHSWMGFTGFTFDELPHIGVRNDNIFYAMGYCGSGTAMATYLGHKVALKIVGSADARTPFDELTFPTKSWYRGSPWFLSGVIAAYRVMDRLRI